MKNSLIPTTCFWCDIGTIVGGKCTNCGALYGRKQRDHKPKVRNGFVLPMVREANATHIEKNLRVTERRQANRTNSDRRSHS